MWAESRTGRSGMSWRLEPTSGPIATHMVVVQQSSLTNCPIRRRQSEATTHFWRSAFILRLDEQDTMSKAKRCLEWWSMFSALQHVSATSHLRSLQSASSSNVTPPWRFSGAWQLGQGNHSVSICPTSHSDEKTNPDGVVFDILPVPSRKPGDIAAATAKATTHFYTFSSKEVTHLTVRDGSVLLLSDDSISYLYRAELVPRGEDNDRDDEDECVTATFPVEHSGIYLLVATEEQSRVEVVISANDHQNEDRQPPSECFMGCGTQAESKNSSPLAEADSGRTFMALVASGIVSLTSLAGVVILRMGTSDVDTLVQYMTTFAAGCLLGVVVFHLYHESAEYLSKQAEWVAGAYVLLGAFLSLAIEVQVHVWLGSHGADSCGGHGHHHGGQRHHPHEDEIQAKPILLAVDSTTPATEASSSIDEDHGNTMEPAAPSSPGPKEQQQPAEEVSSVTIEPVAWITAIGDFFHAFTDGVVLAVAFRSCSVSLGWAVTLGIVLHEVPHRIGDFFVFLKAGMNEGQALAVNLLASLGSLLGVLVLFVLGKVSDETLGAMLATGAGALLFIAMAELLPPVLSVRHQCTALFHLFWFALGGGLLWLSVFLDVECEVS